MKFAFLILHYKNADVTMNCIDSILNGITGEQYDIIVVDNASENGSYEELNTKYRNQGNIHFLVNKENLGYARGNNVGFSYAKHELKAEWICLANSDVIFHDSAWVDKILREYERSPFYLLGPDIVTPDGKHQNPFRPVVAGKQQVVKSLVHDIIVYALLKLGIQRKLRSKMKLHDTEADVKWENTYEDFQGVLHGSCLVFSPDYVKEFEGLYGGTFLYAEEEILCYILRKLNYRYTYFSGIQVTHCHATTMKQSIQDEDKRKMIIIKHRIRSYRRFLNIVCSRKDVGRYLKG